MNIRLPVFVLPSVFGRIMASLPQWPPSLLLSQLLNLALDRVLSRETLEPLLGKRLRLCVEDAGLSLDFMLAHHGFAPCRGDADAVPALCMSAKLRDFMALGLREEDADTLFFQRRLSMTGDTELGLLVKNTLDAIDWSQLQLPFDLEKQRAWLAALLPTMAPRVDTL